MSETTEKDEVAAARRERFNTALEALTPDDLNGYLRRVPIEVSRSVMARLPIKLDPRFVKGGVGKLLHTNLRRLPPMTRLELAADLTGPVDHAAADLLGEEAFESPGAEDLDRMVGHLVEAFPLRFVRVYLACTAAAEADVADQLDRLLDEDTRLQP